MDEIIKKFTNKSLPHFFKYAKDKNEEQVDEINDSFVNKLSKIVPNIRISFKYMNDDKKGTRLSKPFSVLMMTDEKFTLKKEHDVVIEKYLELAKKYYFKIDFMSVNKLNGVTLKNSQLKQKLMFDKVTEETRNELLSLGYNESEVVDILVKYLYDEKDSKYKDMLWNCFGEVIYNNLLKRKSQKKYKQMFDNKTKIVRCIDCGEWFSAFSKGKSLRCPNCNLIEKKELAKLRKRKQREREKIYNVTQE